jgi:hypothetical protein
MTTQRALLVKEIKNLQREKKMFFPPSVAKLNLVQLNDMLNELKLNKPQSTTPQQSTTSQQSNSLPLQPIQQLQLQPVQKQEQKLEPIQDSDDEEVEKEAEQLKAIRNINKVKPGMAMSMPLEEVKHKSSAMTEDEADEIMVLFNEDVLVMLDDYDINNMEEEDCDSLTQEWDQLRKELDQELICCVDKRLRSKINRCINANRKTVSSYLY